MFKKPESISRRNFISHVSRGVTAGILSNTLISASTQAYLCPKKPAPKFGLVTYLWGRDWDLPTLLRNCETTGVLGVELRTTHDHGVETSLSGSDRALVRKMFEDSPVELLGPGSNENFDSPDSETLATSIKATQDFLKLSADVGGSGVKVKPNSFHKEVPREKTLEQIGLTLNKLGKFASDLGQEIRLEVHGQCAPPPYIAKIMEIADHPSVRVCWNCNQEDLEGAGMEAHFKLLRSWFGDTVHVRELDETNYPYREFLKLIVDSSYTGWVLLEARGNPANRVQALMEQRRLFEEMVSDALV